jgi:hypothetical protein
MSETVHAGGDASMIGGIDPCGGGMEKVVARRIAEDIARGMTPEEIGAAQSENLYECCACNDKYWSKISNGCPSCPKCLCRNVRCLATASTGACR